MNSKIDGAVIAVDMLREIKTTIEACCKLDGMVPFHLEAEYRQAGEPQRNIVQEYLERVRAAEDSDLERGFTTLLTEYVASCVAGGVPSAELYDRSLIAAEISRGAGV